MQQLECHCVTNSITREFHRVGSNVKTKRNEVQPGKVSVTPSSVKKTCLQAALRKDRSDGAPLTAGGRLLQARAAATGNARSPSVERLVRLTIRVKVSGPEVTAGLISHYRVRLIGSRQKPV